MLLMLQVCLEDSKTRKRLWAEPAPPCIGRNCVRPNLRVDCRLPRPRTDRDLEVHVVPLQKAGVGLRGPGVAR